MSGAVPLLKFTPSAQDPRVLEAITVQREPLIAKLVEDALDVAGGARHRLLIGSRGMGKTHILTLVASRVLAADKSDSVVLAWLKEDPWAISTYEKFLAAIVACVAEESSDRDLARKAEELHAGRDSEGHEGEQVLRDALGGSRLVLLAENLDEIFRRIGDNGQERFRAFVEDWQQMLILATAPQLFEGIQLHESPFYGFFGVTHLDELSLDSATELMRRVAELRGDGDLIKFLGTDVARRRLEAIEALAGGHPRIWLLLSGCVSIEAIDELVPLFVEALDDLTPYYQDRLRELGDQQQELIVLLSEAGGALSNRALAGRSGIAQNQIATMLRQLTERGYVRRAEVSDELAGGDARMSFWELREPLMRLCLDVKQARGEPLRMVVEFLRAWYGPRLLDELAGLPPSARLATSYVREAFRTMEGTLPPEALFRGSPSEILARAELGLSLDPDRPDLQIARVTGLLMEGQFAAARDELEALIAAEESEQIRLALSLQLVNAKEALGEPTESDALAEGLLRLAQAKPDDADAQGLAATGLSTLDRHDEALKIFPRALELGPENATLTGQYGRSLGEVRRHEDALDAFTKASALDPDNPSIHANCGIALRRLGREEDALAAFERAAELDPAKAAYRRNQGVALENLGRDEEAMDAYARGLELDPDDAKMHGRHGVALRRLGRYEEALAAFSRAAEIDPDSAFFQERLGVVLNSLGRRDEALVALDRAVALDPNNPAVQSNHGSVLSAVGRYDEALEAFSRAIELDPEDGELQSNLGVALMSLRRYESALAAFETAVGLNPDDPVFHGNIGVVLNILGRPEEALSAFARGIELDPAGGYLFEAQGIVLEENDRLDEALAAFRIGSEVDPTNPRHFNHQANLLRNLGRLDEAEQAVRRAIELDRDNPIYRFTLSEVSLTRGDSETALAQLREALAAWSEKRATVPGETDLLCRILWQAAGTGAPRRRLIDEIVAAYDEVGAGEELGRGLVSSIPLMADPEVSVETATAWAGDWLAARKIDDLALPMKLVRTAAEWKKDRNRSHLLDLPPEQREILVGLLEPQAN